MEQIGMVHFGGGVYEAEVDNDTSTLFLHTYNHKHKLGVSLVMKESVDSDERWNSFWKEFAKAAAKYYSRSC
jgi:hypothetical protein